MIDAHSILQELNDRRDQEVLAIVRRFALTADDLMRILTAPALTPANVQDYLNKCTKEELANHFYISGLVKLSEAVTEAQKNHEQQPTPAEAGAIEAGSDEGQPS